MNEMNSNLLIKPSSDMNCKQTEINIKKYVILYFGRRRRSNDKSFRCVFKFFGIIITLSICFSLLFMSVFIRGTLIGSVCSA